MSLVISFLFFSFSSQENANENYSFESQPFIDLAVSQNNVYHFFADAEPAA